MGGSSQGESAVAPVGSGAQLVILGAGLLAVQNAVLFGGFVVALGVDVSSGFEWARVALLLDVPGMALLGAGLSSMAARTGASRLGAALCFAWIGVTATWRWVLPGLAGRPFDDVLIGIWGSDGAERADRVAGTPTAAWMLILWIVASGLLVGVPLSLRREAGWAVGTALLEDRIDPRTWEGFVALNVTGTFLVAGSLLAILAGGTVGALLQAGILIKVAFAPSSGAFAYAYVARRAWRSLRGPEAEAAPSPGRAARASGEPDSSERSR